MDIDLDDGGLRSHSWKLKGTNSNGQGTKTLYWYNQMIMFVLFKNNWESKKYLYYKQVFHPV